MKKLSILTALVAMLFLAGCQPGFSEKNLYGTWENADKPGDYKVYENSFVVPLYLHEGDSVFATYKWGHEWYEKDRKESDLVKYGNGWYMWKLQGKQLYEVQMTDKSWEGSLTPVTLTIKTLTASEFQFERAGRTYLYKKK